MFDRCVCGRVTGVRTVAAVAALLVLATGVTGCRLDAGGESAPTAGGGAIVLEAEQWWLPNRPRGERFDASGLVRTATGELLTINDQSPGVWRLVFHEEQRSVDLVAWPDVLTPSQRQTLAAEKSLRWDCEGLALDERGRLYVCEEANRWILRWDPALRSFERLAIDWTPVRRYFHPSDLNASFEGVAVHGDRLYVANERQTGRIIVVDLNTLKVVDDFAVAPGGSEPRDPHYSDLCWADGALWVLMRDVRQVLKVDPTEKQVLAEFDYAAMERAQDVAYGVLYTPGFMEGIAVDERYIWLVSDNNGMGRRRASQDARPTLFRCLRPDRKGR